MRADGSMQSAAMQAWARAPADARGRVKLVTSVFSAMVKGGVIVADDVDLPEGTTVTVMVDDPEDDYTELTADEEAELEAAIAAGDRGEGVPWDTVRDELRRSHT